MCAGMLPVNQSFGAGMGPILLDNVTCDQSHLELLQCVHPKDISVHDCDQENVVGVICPYVSDASTITSTVAVIYNIQTFKHSSKHYIRNYLRSYSSKQRFFLYYDVAFNKYHQPYIVTLHACAGVK